MAPVFESSVFPVMNSKKPELFSVHIYSDSRSKEIKCTSLNHTPTYTVLRSPAIELGKQTVFLIPSEDLLSINLFYCNPHLVEVRVSGDFFNKYCINSEEK